MPLYEYFCSSCRSKFELLRPLSCAEQNIACPQCHNEAQRILSSFSAFRGAANGEEYQQPIAGTMSSCASCGAASCDTCH